MFITDPIGPTYVYQGETVIIEATLTAQRHRRCFDAAGIPAPGHSRSFARIAIEPRGVAEAARLRDYLREENIRHRCDVTVSFGPEVVTVAEFDALLELAASEPVAPGLLAQTAHAALAHECGDSDATAIAILHRRLGLGGVHSRIEAAQAHERDVRTLISLAASSHLESGALDEAIHERAARAASEINHGGLEAQIRQLVARGDGAEVRRLIARDAR